MANDPNRARTSFPLTSNSNKEYHQPSRATLGNAAEALSPWKRMLDRIEEDVSERRTSQFVAEMPRETHLDPALAKDYGFDPGRHDTIAFDLDSEMRLTQRAYSLDPLHGMEKLNDPRFRETLQVSQETQEKESIQKEDVTAPVEGSLQTEQRPKSLAARTERIPSSQDVPNAVPSFTVDPRGQRAMTSIAETVREDVADGRLSVSAVSSSLGPKKRVHFPVQYTASPVPGRQSASLVYPSRGSFSLTESTDMRSSMQPMQQRATIDAAMMIAPGTFNAMSSKKPLPPVRESGEMAEDMSREWNHPPESAQHLTLRDFMRLAEMDVDEDRHRRSSLVDAGMTGWPVKTPAESLVQQLQYLTGELVEEQVYRNANAGLKQLYHKTSNSIREQEISFAQRNPPVVRKMQQTGRDRLEGLKNKLRTTFSENRTRGQQQWKEARSRLEAEYIELLKKINGVLEEDLGHLTKTETFVQWATRSCKEAKRKHQKEEEQLNRAQQEIQALEDQLRHLQSENEKLAEKKAIVVTKQRELQKVQREKAALQTEMDRITEQDNDDESAAKERRQWMQQVLDAQLKCDVLHKLQPFTLHDISESHGQYTVGLQIGKLFTMEIRYPNSQNHSPGVTMKIGLLPMHMFSKFYTIRHAKKQMQASRSLLGLTPSQNDITVQIHEAHGLCEAWMKIHAIQCLVDELYALRQKGPPFVGYNIASDTLVMNFCSSKRSAMVSLLCRFRPYEFPYQFMPDHAKVKLIIGDDDELVKQTKEQLSHVKTGPFVISRMADAIKM